MMNDSLSYSGNTEDYSDATKCFQKILSESKWYFIFDVGYFFLVNDHSLIGDYNASTNCFYLSNMLYNQISSHYRVSDRMFDLIAESITTIESFTTVMFAGTIGVESNHFDNIKKYLGLPTELKDYSK